MKKIIKDLKEFAKRLKRGDKIEVTRVAICLSCNGKGCEYCHKGYTRHKTTM